MLYNAALFFRFHINRVLYKRVSKDSSRVGRDPFHRVFSRLSRQGKFQSKRRPRRARAGD